MTCPTLNKFASFLHAMESLPKQRTTAVATPEPQPYQVPFVADTAPVVIALGGNRSGKTEAGAIKAATRLLSKPPWYGAPFWIVGQSYEMAAEVCWIEKLSKYIPESMIRDIAWMSQRLGWPKTIMLTNGWRIELKSQEQGREKFQARSVGGAWIDEQFSESIFVEMFARTSESAGQIFATLTPINPDPFLQERFENGHAGWSFHKFSTRSNQFLREDWVDSFESQIPDAFRSVRLLGDFGGFEGTVYPMFTRKLYVIEPLPPASIVNKSCTMAIDFGFSNPFVCLWGYKDSDGGWTIFDEYYQPQRRMAEHCTQIKARNQGRHIARTWADPEDAQARAELTSLGLSTLSASKSVRKGIEEVQRLMMVRPNGEPRLKITSNCVNLIRELSSYRWEPKSERRQPDQPLKVDDHTCDALRYLLFSESLWGVKIPEGKHFSSGLVAGFSEVMNGKV